jgi:hypothetical protein
MVRARAYKVKDFSEVSPKVTVENIENSSAPFDLRMLGGIVEDFNSVRSALIAFPFKSAFSLVGLAAVLYVAFKVGQNFGIIQTRFKGKGK